MSVSRRTTKSKARDRGRTNDTERVLWWNEKKARVELQITSNKFNESYWGKLANGLIHIGLNVALIVAGAVIARVHAQRKAEHSAPKHEYLESVDGV